MNPYRQAVAILEWHAPLGRGTMGDMSNDTSDIPSSKRNILLLATGVALMALLTFGRSVGFEWLHYDDPQYVTENPYINQGLTLEGLREAFTHGLNLLWIPLTSISYMLGVSLHGLSPAGHHATNVLLHAVNAVLVLLVFRRLTGSLWAATLAAFLFAVHPLQAEVVAWVSGRKDLLATFFWLLTLWAYTRFADHPTPRHILPVYLLFALGMASKVTMVTLPAILLLLDWRPFARVWEWRKLPHCLALLVYEKLAMFGMGAFAVWWALRLHVDEGGIRTFDQVSLGMRAMNAIYVYAFHLVKVFVPTNLTVHYPYFEQGPPMPLFAGACALLLLVTLACVLMLRRQPLLLVGWLWYLLALLPSVGLARVDSFLTADRYVYVPMLGVYLMIGVAVAALVEARPALQRALSIAVVLWVAALSCLGYLQTNHWRNDLTLFGHAATVYPDNPPILNGYGTALRRADRIEEARTAFERARAGAGPFRILPTMNLAMLSASQQQWEEAQAYLREILMGNPTYAPAYSVLLQVLHDASTATPDPVQQATFEQEARVTSIQAAIATGQPVDPVPTPEHAMALDRLGLAWLGLERPDAALEYFKQASMADPTQPRYPNLVGTVHFMQGQFAEAAAQFKTALDIDPAFLPALMNYGLMDAELNTTAGKEAFQRALQAKPNDMEMRKTYEEIFGPLP
jgi:tetratricopeptide (TPR) repeat protein